MNYEWHDIVGNIGVAFILGTYLSLQLQRIDPESLRFSVLNCTGAALVLVSLAIEFNLSAFIIEGAWLIISLLGVIRYFTRPASVP